MWGADINYMLGGTNILNTALSNIFSLQYIGFLHKFVLYKGLRGGLATISKTEIKIARRLEISIKKNHDFYCGIFKQSFTLIVLYTAYVTIIMMYYNI